MGSVVGLCFLLILIGLLILRPYQKRRHNRLAKHGGTLGGAVDPAVLDKKIEKKPTGWDETVLTNTLHPEDRNNTGLGIEGASSKTMPWAPNTFSKTNAPFSPELDSTAIATPKPSPPEQISAFEVHADSAEAHQPTTRHILEGNNMNQHASPDPVPFLRASGYKPYRPESEPTSTHTYDSPGISPVSPIIDMEDSSRPISGQHVDKRQSARTALEKEDSTTISLERENSGTSARGQSRYVSPEQAMTEEWMDDERETDTLAQPTARYLEEGARESVASVKSPIEDESK